VDQIGVAMNPETGEVEFTTETMDVYVQITPTSTSAAAADVIATARVKAVEKPSSMLFMARPP
jgi:hypothetical protein